MPAAEFRYNPELKVGDKVEVYIQSQEDKKGQLVLSHKEARTARAWDRVNEAYNAGEIVTGYIKWRSKGGMIVDVLGMEAFLPGSQIDVKPVRDYIREDPILRYAPDRPKHSGSSRRSAP